MLFFWNTKAADVRDQRLPEGGQQGAQEAGDDVLGGRQEVRCRREAAAGDDPGACLYASVYLACVSTAILECSVDWSDEMRSDHDLCRLGQRFPWFTLSAGSRSPLADRICMTALAHTFVGCGGTCMKQLLRNIS